MRIAIDARLYGLQHRGIGRYLKELLPRLVPLAPDWHFVLLVDPRNVEQPEQLSANVSLVNVPARVYTLAEQWRVTAALRAASVDLTHFPHFSIPLMASRPFVATLHDLILHEFPSERATTQPWPLYRLKLLGYRVVLAAALRGASSVMVPSLAVARNVARYYPWAESKLRVVPLAPGSKVVAGATTLPEAPYVLNVGAAYPHKNLERAVEAVALARRTRPGLRLVVVGRRDIFMDRLAAFSRSRGLAQAVEIWGEAGEAELAALYQGAACYLQPSLAEGFGLPPLEAIQHGCPVVAADIPVLREVLNDAATYADPGSVAQLAQAIVAAVGRRGQGAGAAANVLARYSWERVAEQTLATYQSALEPLNV